MADSRTADAGPATVYTLDNVAVDLPVAGVGSRVLAAFLDYLVIGVLATAWLLFSIAFLTPFGGTHPMVGVILVVLIFLGLFALEYGYFAGFEIALGGQTPGKRALGLVVVTREGARPTPGGLLTRNLVRVIDLMVGVPLMILDASARRLGDRLAGTLVVYRSSLGRRPPSAARVPRGWGGREVALLESFLRREPELDPDVARTVATRLVNAIRRDDPRFFEELPQGGDPCQLLRRATASGNR